MDSGAVSVRLVYVDAPESPAESAPESIPASAPESTSEPAPESGSVSSRISSPSPMETDDQKPPSLQCNGGESCANPEDATSSQSQFSSPVVDHNWLHHRLKVLEINTSEGVEEYISNHLNQFKQWYGVLLFLYSALLTRRMSKEDLATSELSSLISSHE